MITIFQCSNELNKSLKVSRLEDLLELELSGSFMETENIYLSKEDLHSFIGHLLRIQKEIKKEVSND